MRRVMVVAVAAAASFLVLSVGAASAPRDELTPPMLLEPAQGQVIAAGTPIVFRIATYPGDRYLWLLVSRSPAVANACGTIAFDAEIESFQATSDPAIYEARPARFSHSTFWMNSPGTYYWQAYRIEHGSGADGCVESEVRSLEIVGGTAPSPSPPPPAPPAPPKPTPKAPLAVSKARLAGTFSVTTRVTSAAGIGNVKRGTTDQGDWVLTPRCSSGACDVRLQVSYGFAGSTKARMQLKRKGATYTGSGKVALTTCMFKPVPGTMTVGLTVRRGAWIRGAWRATRITGTYRYSAGEFTTGLFRCRASAVNAVVTGRLDAIEP